MTQRIPPQALEIEQAVLGARERLGRRRRRRGRGGGGGDAGGGGGRARRGERALERLDTRDEAWVRRG